MKLSVLPIWVLGVFAFCLFIARRAKHNQAINTKEARSAYVLLLTLFVWTLISTVLGIKGIHASPWLQERIPLLWQANVPVVIVVIGLLLSPTLRSALRGIVSSTPWHWLVFFSGVTHWGTGRSGQRDQRRNHIQLCVLGRHPRLFLRPLRSRRGVAGSAKSRQQSLPDGLELDRRSNHPTADIWFDELFYE